ncbi:MAG: DUF2953 domain-containing protein [Clostridiaceae bacterium]|nr:DUF2953 domain-containing protein [Clostridiaceae bacterium]
MFLLAFLIFILILVLSLFFLKLSFILSLSFDEKGFDMTVKVMFYRLLTLYRWNIKEGGFSFLSKKKEQTSDKYKKKKGKLSGALKILFSEDTFNHVKKNMEVFDVSIKGRIATNNAAETAMIYGSIWWILGMLIPFIPQKKLFLDFYPDFQEDCPDFHITCILRAKITHIIVLVAVQKFKKIGKGRSENYGTASY